MNTFARLFAIALVLTGAAASTQIANASSKTAVTAKTSAWPVPMCPPGDPTQCGMGQMQGN